jgi:two-component system sensor histidine kinase/response regulator
MGKRARIRKLGEKIVQEPPVNVADLLESVSDAIIFTDLNFIIKSWNKAAETIYGWRADEVIGKPTQEILSIVYLPGQREEIVRQFDEQGSWKGELPQKRKDGTTLSIYSSITLLKDSAGQPMGAVAINQDTTDRKRAEERIAWLASFPERNPNPVVEVDLAGHIRYCNPAAQRLLPDLPTAGFQHPWLASLEAVVDQFQKGEKTSAIRDVVFDESWYQQTLYYVPETHCMRIYSADITDRKQAEQRLNNEKNRLEAVMEALPVGVAILDAQGGNVQSNRAFEQVWGSPRPETHAVSDYAAYKAWWVDTGLPVQPEEWASARAVHGKEIVIGQVLHIERFDGARAFVLNSAVPILDARDQVVGSAVAIMDITARMEAEEALQESEAKYRRLVEHMNDLVCEIDTDATFLFVSPQYKQVLGYTPQELLGSSVKELIHPDHRRVSGPKFQKVVDTRAPSRDEWRFKHKNGEWRWLECTSQMYEKSPGEIRVVVISRDITARKQAEQELKQLNEDLESRVIERTVQLETANRTLQDEIVEREQIEENLRESEARFRELFETSLDGIVVSDLQGQYLDCNRAYLDLLGYDSVEDLRNRSYQAVTPPEYYAFEDRILTEQVLPRGYSEEYEKEYVRKTGERVSVSLRIWLRRDSRQQPIGVWVIVRDIMERKRAEAELRKYREHLEELVKERTARLEEEINERQQMEEELRVTQIELEQQNEELRMTRDELLVSYHRYSDLYDFAPVGYCTIDSNRVIVEANLTAATLFGVDRGQLIKARLDQFIAEADRDHFFLHIRQLGQIKTRKTCEVGLVKPDGTQLFVQLDSIMAEDRHNPDEYYRTAITDITERKRAEEALQETRDYLDNLLNYANAPIVVWDPAFRITRFNHAFEHLTGYSAAQVLGQPLEMLFPADKRAESLNYIQRTATGERWESVEIAIFCGDGTVRTVLWNSATLYALDCQTVVATIAQGQDITERKRVEGELQKAKDSADAANRAKSEFLANMSHELRTPLNAILGFAQILERDATLSAKQRKNLTIISRSGEHLLNLINDILELSKIEAGQNTLVPTSFDLYHTLEDIEAMVRFRAEKKGLHLDFEWAPEVPRYIITDERKLRQVLLNLLGNAVKFTEQGGVTLRVNVKECKSDAFASQSSALTLLFEVADTGPGIAPEDLERIFQAFTQTQSGQRSQEGTGLGLTISRRFVDLMGGEITVSSQVGQGASFTVDLPLELAETPTILSQQSPPRHVIGLEPAQPAYRILIADDNPESRLLLRELLEPLGFDVREATNGADTVALHECWRPHLIWMDMRMPVMDGYEATKRIKATLKGYTTVIIAVTASAFEEDRMSVLTAGCDDFVRKPFRAAEIFAMLHNHLGVRYVYEELGNAPLPTQTLAEAFIPAALAALPADVLANLEYAALRTNITLIASIIGQIRPYDAGLAEALTRLADDFDYEQMLTLIRHAKEEP